MAASVDLKLPGVQGLQSQEQIELLNIVDSLRALGLSEITDLPQLVVCGDQSSGKSSVLEAISGFPFPKQENICTRFATEVNLRRSSAESITGSIVPAGGRTAEDQATLSQFRQRVNTREDVESLFENAKAAMGLSEQGNSFSKDVLKVEICGPNQPQLTLVDLPGLIHSASGSKAADDIDMVKNLVQSYISNKRSIILAVVSAMNDTNNQVILRRAGEVDPKGMRTLGIITKPDTLPSGSRTEEAFLKLARNENVKFELGWHVVRNLNAAVDAPQEDRDEKEATYFRESNFKNLPSHRVGIENLRSRLSKVLFNQIRTELPRLVEDIDDLTRKTILERDKLGPSRAGIDEQRSFLVDLSQSFHSICQDAVKAEYEHPFFQSGTDPAIRLCSNLMNQHVAFAKNLRQNGVLWNVVDKSSSIFSYRIFSREAAIQDACQLLKRSRGQELPGLPNPHLVGELFRQYSKPWENIARDHIKSVWETTRTFLEKALQHLTDTDVSDRIMRLWLHPIMEKRLDVAYGKLNELLAVHKDHPLTTNPCFMEKRRQNLQKKRTIELEATLKRNVGFGKPDLPLSMKEFILLADKTSLEVKRDVDMIAAEEAFDDMNAFYEVAMNLFMDNVPTLAIHAPIVREVPLMFYPTIVVTSMSVDIITAIAGESKDKVNERQEILRKLATLEAGARICRQYAIRPQQSMPKEPGARTPGAPLILDEIDKPTPSVDGKKLFNFDNSTSLFANAMSGNNGDKFGATNLTPSFGDFGHRVFGSEVNADSKSPKSDIGTYPGDKFGATNLTPSFGDFGHRVFGSEVKADSKSPKSDIGTYPGDKFGATNLTPSFGDFGHRAFGTDPGGPMGFSPGKSGS